MKEKLYYLNPYTKSFSANVVKQEQGEDGDWFVVLDQTAFYPTGGGQPYDEGTIDGRKVLNVEEVEGEIRHYLDGPLQEIQVLKTGEIDWARRFDHMQQHCGQHILSAAFDHLFQYKTVGFHLGAETLTIDLETENLTKEEATKAEELANKIILDNRLIEVKWVTEEELSQYSLRKETKVKEDIRLVIIPDFDYNGCGGTHPNTTGEVSTLKILDWERQKKKVRVQFVCGNRVIQQLDRKQQILLKLTKLLNSPEKEMEAAVLRLLDSGKSLEKALEQAKESLLLFEAKELTSASAFLEGNKMAAEVFHNRSIQELQKLARFVTTEDNQALVFFVSETENRLQLVFARGVARTENMKTLIGEILPLIQGKGGGNESFAQGGGELLMPAEEILHKILTMVN